MTRTHMLKFDQAATDELVELYDLAVRDGRAVFPFQGQTVVTLYAKYMIEYLSTEFEIRGA